MNKQKLTGTISGLCLLSSIYFPPLIVAAIAITSTSCATSLTKKRTLLLMLVVTYTILVSTKSYSTGTLDYRFLVSNFSIFILGFFITIKITSEYIKGLTFPANLLFTLDILFNIWIFLFDQDFLGRTASIRDDGNRYGGVVGHAFYSISISMVYIMFGFYNKKSILYISLGIINILLAGSFRGILHVIYLLVFIGFLKRFKWKSQIILASCFIASIVLSTMISVSSGYFKENSGNYFRIFAWGNALSLIIEEPIYGAKKSFSKWEEGMGVTENTISDTGTTESTFLGDLVRNGVPITSIKLLIIILIFYFIFNKNKKKHTNNQKDIIKYIPIFLLIDYIILSIWGSLFISFISAAFISYGFTSRETIDLNNTQAFYNKNDASALQTITKNQ